jgi:hypothetical protein
MLVPIARDRESSHDKGRIVSSALIEAVKNNPILWHSRKFNLAEQKPAV